MDTKLAILLFFSLIHSHLSYVIDENNSKYTYNKIMLIT